MRKLCSRCNIEKELNSDNFIWRADRKCWDLPCKMCKREYLIQYSATNKDKKKKYDKNRYSTIKSERMRYLKKYYKENKKRLLENSKEYKKIWRINNRQKINKQQRDRVNSNIKIKLDHRLSTAIYQDIKSNGGKKNNSKRGYLPYTIEELKAHLEGQFEPWMNWNNWGQYRLETWDDNDSSTWTWQIDHIMPRSKFTYTSMEDDAFTICWALNNLRPLNSKQNVSDGDRREI